VPCTASDGSSGFFFTAAPDGSAVSAVLAVSATCVVLGTDRREEAQAEDRREGPPPAQAADQRGPSPAAQAQDCWSCWSHVELTQEPFDDNDDKSDDEAPKFPDFPEGLLDEDDRTETRAIAFKTALVAEAVEAAEAAEAVEAARTPGFSAF
jgi:hypothetical protein